MNRTRRAVLRGGAGLLAASGLAGCADVLGSPNREGVRTSFYLLYDFADRIAGDRTAVESVAQFGQHGHGWQLTGRDLKEIYTSTAFVYVGEGFQPWADDVVESLRSDDAGVTIVEARRGIAPLGEDSDHDDEGGDHGGDHEGGDHEGHGASGDPHFWLDPLRAKVAVDNVRDGLIEADAAGEEHYRERAAAYRAEIDDLHATFRSRLDGAERSHVLVAGHDSFRYLAERYGFTTHAISGVSPDEEPSGRAIREAQATIERYGIEHVLTPAMESDRAARQLVAETDATEVLTVSALSGITEEWTDRGWGYVDVMENVNLDALAKALGAQ